jgi:DNA-binding IclR family transcriptional regulator
MADETLKSLKKALDILTLFLNSSSEMSLCEMTLSEISRNSGLAMSTTNRIISMLVKYNYLKRREKRGKYFLGPIYLNFSRVINSKARVKNIASDHIMKLSHQVNEVSVIAFENGIKDIVAEAFVDSTTADSILKIAPNAAGSLPLYCSSLGKIILSGLSEAALQDYLNTTDLKSYTHTTIADPDRLKRLIKKIGKEKVSFDDEELYVGVRSVAAAIIDNEDKIIGAIAVIAPSARMSVAMMKELAPVVTKYARDISHDIRTAYSSPI